MAEPMLGCIGVAPKQDYSPGSGPAGYWGGNLDYNLIREGATVLLPVFHRGGLLFFGDGHALQGDGEAVGSGVETSLDVVRPWKNSDCVKVYSIDMLSVFCSPSRYTQGRNATASLGQEIVNLGLEGPALIVAGKSAIALLSGVWESSLHTAGLMHSILRFGGECSLLEIEKGKAAARQSDARIIIGAGGGKVLDTARAVASDLNLPVVNCPTVASSDAPCSALSVVYTDEGVFQEYRIYRRNPDLVLVDTEVIARSPARLLVAGMGDALATWFEAKVCADGNVRNMRGGASTRSALALAELCYRTLLEDGVAGLHALQTQVVTPALDRLVEANTLLSGLGFESSGLAAAHSIHNGLTAAAETHHFFHGEKVAFGVLVQLMMESKPRATVEEVLDFSTSVGLPITFADIGLVSPGDEVLKQIARRGTAKGETIHNEPFKVSCEVVVDALRAANDAGEDWKRRHRREMSTPPASP